MSTRRVTLLLPEEIIDEAERVAIAQKTTRHNFLCELIISQLGNAAEDKNAEKIKEIADLQRVSISILSRMWGERNPEAGTIIRNMMAESRRR